MVEEMEKPLVIGKAAKPRCCKNLKSNNLPVIWRNNKKAWITAATMEEWHIQYKDLFQWRTARKFAYKLMFEPLKTHFTDCPMGEWERHSSKTL
jgi:hypothetical protein